MEEKKIKKKKLTLTVSTKKPYNIPHYKTFSQKKSVVIEKKISRKKMKRNFTDKLVVQQVLWTNKNLKKLMILFQKTHL